MNEILRQNPVEVIWRTARNCANGNCVAVAEFPGERVAMRDTKVGDSPILEFTLPQWRTFLRQAKAGLYDLPLPPQK
ncbi:DUF397 domain-containing protein [Microbispora sp. ATCC PTA-5024]|uniref:DUF397 domain-containing protein n=1 Tax=Microbispora sp. ATCC PTA-5024 TaxID=316330 RepID=UPI0009FED570|nr:DUF397 domain-containing protein [Microbispora sp. ATCC PTA-5024]